MCRGLEVSCLYIHFIPTKKFAYLVTDMKFELQGYLQDLQVRLGP